MKVTKKAKVVLGVIILILIGTLSIATNYAMGNGTDDRAQIENVMITYARSMDHLDKDAWSSCFSDNLINYYVDRIVAPGETEIQLDISEAHEDNAMTLMLWMLSDREKDCLLCPWDPTLEEYRASFTAMSIKERLVEMGDMLLFERIDFGQSHLTNFVIDLDYGDANEAKAYDYFRHWEDIIPTHLANIGQLMNDQNWYFMEGEHEYILEKEDGQWKIVDFKCHIWRSYKEKKQ